MRQRTGRVSAERQKRSEQIAQLKGLFQEVQGGVLTDFRGLNMLQVSDLRRRFREKGVGYKVIKNTLASIAVKGTSYQTLEDLLKGPTGIAFTKGDPILPAKVAVEFSKDHESLGIKGGFMEGQVLSQAQVLEVSRIAGKKELMAQLLSVVNGPSQKFLGVLNGVPQKFLGVLKAQADKLGTA